MASIATPYLYPESQHISVLVTAACVFLFLTVLVAIILLKSKAYHDALDSLNNFAKFFYVSFLKPHTGDNVGGQQGALESFYGAQVRGWPLNHIFKPCLIC